MALREKQDDTILGRYVTTEKATDATLNATPAGDAAPGPL